MYDAVVTTLGHPDILFGNHGAAMKVIGPLGDIKDISPELFEQTWRLNTGTNYYVSIRVLSAGDCRVDFCTRRLSCASYASHTWKRRSGVVSS